MSERALVLGGGGPVGIAWQAGVLAGLTMEGVAILPADLILGTSAGSFVGAQIAGGRDPIDFAQAQLKLGQGQAQHDTATAPAFDPSSFAALIAKMPPDAEPSPEMRREFGRLSQSAATIPVDA
jgi:NTE family protein